MKATLLRRAGALAAAVPLALILIACGHSTEAQTITAVAVNGGAGYTPTTIVANKEDTLSLTVANTTDKTHGFSIEGYKIATTVDPTKTIKVEFRLGQAGTFKIFCQLHPTHQTATLIVR